MKIRLDCFKQDLANKLNIQFLETSAKTSSNVEQTFIIMATEIKKHIETLQISDRPITLNTQKCKEKSKNYKLKKCF